jgi:hypothetical protein
MRSHYQPFVLPCSWKKNRRHCPTSQNSAAGGIWKEYDRAFAYDLKAHVDFINAWIEKLRIRVEARDDEALR